MWLSLLCPGLPKNLLRCHFVLALDPFPVKALPWELVPSQQLSRDCGQN